jgi:orotidine-5'-phosphate decarboxylase
MAEGPRFVEKLAADNRIFLDLKYYDIPDTTAAAVKAAASLGVFMVNLHASGGRKMLTAAREAIANLDKKPILLAVTALTSMDNSDLYETGCSHNTDERVALLAKLAAESGLDGVVCSPLEINIVKNNVSKLFITVTPGVRPENEDANDQVRVASPSEVVRAGGDYLVVGRPITRSDDPGKTTMAILREMGVHSE